MHKKEKKLFVLAVTIMCVLMAGAQAWGDVAIDISNFPDDTFRAYVSENFDTDGDNYLSYSEIAEVKSITLTDNVDYNIYSLKGIEFFRALTWLDCNGNCLTDCDVSKNTALTYLNCSNTHLTILDVTKNTALTHLNCSNNSLMALNVDNNTALTYLDCSSNILGGSPAPGEPSVFQVTRNTALNTFNCSNCGLETLDVTQNKALISLNCSGNSLSTLDLTKNTALTSLNCSENYSLDSLYVSKNTALTTLDCSRTDITALNITQNTALTTLNCSRNQLTTLNVSGCTALTILDCTNNKLTALDLSGCTALQGLDCWGNQLTALDLSKNAALTHLSCDGNQLTVLDLSKNAALTHLSCGGNQLTVLDLSKNTALRELQCVKNQLTALDLSKNAALTYLYCEGNQLTVLDLSKNTALRELQCGKNQLTALDVSNNTDLTELRCEENQLTALDLSKNIILTKLYCANNQLTELDVSKNTALRELYCNNNQLTELDLSNNIALDSLSCEGNQLTALDVSKNTALESLWCGDNQLTELDLSSNTALQSLSFNDQNPQTLSCTRQDDGTYQVNLNDYVQDINRLGSVSGNYDSTTGITTFSSEPSEVRYEYDTKIPDNFYYYMSPCMSVTLTKIRKPVIKTESLPDASQDKAYSHTLEASGEETITWAIRSGNLPEGLSLSSSGIISGTPAESGEFKFTAEASNNYGEDSREFTLEVKEPETPIEITTTSLAKGTAGASYSKTITATGADSFTWSISSGSLPDGLSLGESTGKITGKPTATGDFTFTVRAEANGLYGEKSFTLTIAKAMTISGTLPNKPKLNPYPSTTLKVSGGVSPYTWTKSSGTLPDGLTLDKSTGTISGTPTKAGTFKFKVKVTDKNKAAKTKSYTVKITKTAISGTLNGGKAKAPYTGTLTASNGTAPYKWSISKGSLPEGFSLSNSDGTITGTTTKTGTFTFTVRAEDKNGVAATKEYKIKITKTTISGTLSNGGVKNPYSGTLKASKGTAPYTWTISKGKLPAGLNLNESDGTITGTPTKAGKFSFTVKASDKNKSAATKAFTITVTQPTISGTLGGGSLNADYTGTLTASKGLAPYTWEISKGNLPPGLELTYTNTKATISGKATEAGTYLFAVEAKDSNGGIKTKSFIVVITAPAVYYTFRNGTVSTEYSDYVTAYGGAGPYSWTVSEGSLPDGLELSCSDSDAKLTGKPAKAGTFTFTLTAEDKNGTKASKAFTVTINAVSAEAAKARTEEFESHSDTENDNSLTHKDYADENAQDIVQRDISDSESEAYSHSVTALNVLSDDVLSHGTERDEDLVSVKANQPVRFIIGTWPQKISGESVYIDDEYVENIEIQEGMFTLPAEFVHDDFKVCVKAKAGGYELESQELYISAE